jgi:iron-sulfur cluster repair protein YtfE (RIC family)
LTITTFAVNGCPSVAVMVSMYRLGLSCLSKTRVANSLALHHNLLLCWKIRKGLSSCIEPERIAYYAQYFFSEQLVAHFNDEEKYVFPILGEAHELVQKALREHRRLVRLFEKMEGPTRSLSLIEEELEAHIRFEERVLFPKIQKVATSEQLRTIEEHHTELLACDNWEDPFWK